MSLSIPPSRLLNWKVPEAQHELSRKDVAFYALSVGCGQEQELARSLRYVDPSHPDFVALPSLVLVLAYPGFWLGDPHIGIDSLQIVHAEQSIEILTHIPVEGRVRGRTQITDLIDGGAGKAAFLYSERDLFDEAGCNFARVSQTHILRGAGGFGSIKPRPSLRNVATEGAPRRIAEFATRTDQALLYRLNGDYNPLHSDPTAAKRAGFPQPILHGMCTFGFVTRALIEHLCENNPARLRTVSMRFTGPVYPGETLHVEIFAADSFRVRVAERDSVVVDFGRALVDSQSSLVEVEKHAV